MINMHADLLFYADAFCATRLAGDWSTAFGTLPPGLDLAPVIARTTPKLG